MACILQDTRVSVMVNLASMLRHAYMKKKASYLSNYRPFYLLACVCVCFWALACKRMSCESVSGFCCKSSHLGSTSGFVLA